jgi:tetratricopeptide (TPR) repeat protein
LAAARVRALPVEQIGDRLRHSFAVLATGRRSDAPRHQTLRAAIDWSYGLLAEDERRPLRRLSVFVDSFTLAAAERVGSGPDTAAADVFEVLSRLIDKSLVFVAEREEPQRWRYRLLETVRQYAEEKLAEDGEAAAVALRHIDYYLALAEETEPLINRADRQGWLAALEREHANLRTAIERASSSGDHVRASRLATALFWFWFHRGHWREGRTFLGSAIAHESAARSRARALLGNGVLAWAEGDHGAAVIRLEECAATGRTCADAPTTAHALHFLAMARLAQGDAAAGRPLAQEAVALARTADDVFCLTLALASYGVLLLVLEEYHDARAALEESVACGRQARDTWAVALPLRNLAIVANRQREYEQARHLLEESLHGLRDLGEKWFLSRSIETLAQVVALQGQHERAAHLFGAAESLRDAVGASILPFYRADYDRTLATVRDALGEPAFERCWREGRLLSADDALTYALAEASVHARSR